MSYNNGPRIVTDQLIYCVDAANVKSYPGSGNTVTDLSKVQGVSTFYAGISAAYDPTRFESDALAITDRMYITHSTISFADAEAYSWDYWIKLSSGAEQTYHSLAGSGLSNRWVILYLASASGASWQLRYRDSTSTYYNSPSVTTHNIKNNWAHACFTISAARLLTFYVNGIGIGTGNLTTSSFYLTRLMGGYTSGSNYYPLQGSMAQAKYYRKELSASEVLQNFNATRGRFGI